MIQGITEQDIEKAESTNKDVENANSSRKPKVTKMMMRSLQKF